MDNRRNRNHGCVVTGVAGFVGSHLAERLLSRGISVVGVDNFFSGRRSNMDSFRSHPLFSFHERSITDPSLLGELKELHPEVDRCFHLAAVVSVPYSMDHAEETMRVNFGATLALLEEAESLGFKSFVFAGSAAEYGNDPRLPLFEGYATPETRWLSPYGESKFRASRRIGENPIGVALRFFNIYGPRQDPNSPYSGVISRFMDMALRGAPLTIFGDGGQTRDFVYVADVVNAYLAAADLKNADGAPPPTPNGHIYNIGTGRVTSILELASMVRELSGNREPLAHLPEREGDIRHSRASVEAFREATGWNPEFSLGTGLAATLEW